MVDGKRRAADPNEGFGVEDRDGRRNDTQGWPEFVYQGGRDVTVRGWAPEHHGELVRHWLLAPAKLKVFWTMMLVEFRTADQRNSRRI